MKASLKFKQALRAEHAVAVINVDYPSAGLVEFLAQPELGVDAVMFDAEQGNLDFERLEDMARAARLSGLCVLVRLFSSEPWVIERMLLRGIDGIIVPRLDTANQARAVLEVLRYCQSNETDDKLFIVQIESVAAHTNLDDFLACERIDVYFVGPVDLSRSMGYRGDYTVAPVRTAVDDILQRTRAAGRVAGTMVKPDDVAHWVARGARLLYFHVNDWLRIGARSFPIARG